MNKGEGGGGDILKTIPACWTKMEEKKERQ